MAEPCPRCGGQGCADCGQPRIDHQREAYEAMQALFDAFEDLGQLIGVDDAAECVAAMLAESMGSK